MRIFCTAKDSNIFSTKNNSVFGIFTFENLTKMLTNDIVNFEQLAPEIKKKKQGHEERLFHDGT